jgi:WD40 repeat protein/serine/threonine protein kinase
MDTTMNMNDLSGQTIKGYQLEKLVGQGGFGSVYKAVQPAIKRDVAIKVILPEFVNNPEFVRRFEAEAQIIAHLESLHIVPLHDFWRDQSGAFLVMRWLRGGTLQDVLENGHWPLNDVTRIVDQIASALQVAHRNGVIHRDLKPANILLDDDKNCYLADFGIAKDLEQFTDFSKVEEQGLMGSPDYISPEQIMMNPVTPQTDVYSFGLMLYKILTGHKPFEGNDLSTLISKHLMEELPHLSIVRPDLPADLNEVIQIATQKDPTQRYESAVDVANALREALKKTGDTVLSELDHRSKPAFDLSDLGLSTDTLDSLSDLDIEPENPYKGLRAFQEADVDDFFGRDELIENLVQQLQGDDMQSRFMAVVGPSGSGKSSVVKAGVIPQLRRGAVTGSDKWYIVEKMPGQYPMEELEAALLRIAINPPSTLLEQLMESERGLVRAVKRVLPDDDSELVIVIDQFEEIFTQMENEDNRRFFLNSILEAMRDPKSRLRIIVTLRADFYDRPLNYPEFGQLMRECTTIVLPLNSKELRDAIILPAELNHLELEAGLIEAIIADVGGEPGALPLLQYAMTELYERRDGRWLTVTAYDEIGGALGALTRRATDIYEGLDESRQALLRQMFLRLVTLGEGSEDTRRRVLISELLSLDFDTDKIQSVIDEFGKYRLLTFDRDPINRSPTVEVAHEALIRQWQLLRQWLDTNRDGLRIQRRVAVAMLEWQNMGRDKSFLASGMRLNQFEEWIKSTELATTESEREYIHESIQQYELLEEEKRLRKEHEEALELQSRNRLRQLLTVMTVAAVISIGLMAVAVTQSGLATQAQVEAVAQANNAATQEANAIINADQAQSLAFASSAQLALGNSNTDLGVLLALEANQYAPSSQTLRTLAESGYAPGTIFSLEHGVRTNTVAYSPDGMTILTGAQDSLVRLWSADTGELLQTFEGHTDWIWDVAYSPDGTKGASASSDSRIIVWDLETGEAIRIYEGHTGEVRDVDFSQDGAQILSGSTDMTMKLWDTETGAELTSFDDGLSSVFAVDLSPSGFTALSGFEDGRIVLWSVNTGQALFTYDAGVGGHIDEVWTVAYTSDESGFLSSSEDSAVLLWQFESGIPVQKFLGHSSRVTDAEFSSDGKRIVTGSEDNAVIVWDVTTGAQLRRFLGHTSLVYNIAYNPIREEVASAGWDNTVRIWDLNHGALIRQFNNDADLSHDGVINHVAISSDGALAVTAGADMRLVLWDVETGEPIREFVGHMAGVNAVEFSPDDTLIATAGDDEVLALWDVATGEFTTIFEGHSDAVWDVAYSPDGTKLASASRDNTIFLWDTETGESITRLFGHTFRITGVDFSPDGQYLISSSYDNTILLWDVATGDTLSTFEGHVDWIRDVSFSPDGQTIASGAADNSVILWDIVNNSRLRKYEGHTAQVLSIIYSPDGTMLLSGGSDNTIILWNITTGEEIQRFTDHTDEIQSLAFSPDGGSFISVAGDGTAKLWAVRLGYDALNDWIYENRYIRELTCTERERFGVPPLCAQPTPVVIPGQST